MKKKETKVTRRRLVSSYVTTVVSISLVLLMLGLVGLLLLNTQRLSDYVKENIGFSILLKNDIKEIDIFIIQKSLDAKSYVKSTDYVTKERAAQELIDELGEDFVQYLGHNPLPPSIDVKLFANYANDDSLTFIEEDFKSFSQVQEVVYHKSLLHIINENVKNITLIILAFSALLFLIALALINNTIRLSVYSRRFLINTMQLVGATRNFIRKPFLWQSFVQGMYATIIATGIITAIIYYSHDVFNEIIALTDVEIIAFLYFCILVTGVFMTFISTFFAVNKYLNINVDKLYV
ncbi:MAG: FtsX-like permease family protein [Bacteroidetes bacterium]|nr:FtsX-like permease family protein [Bacteroidota bacterium]